jgi:predicted DNA-binding protein YlxM (UPF0122 family)
MNLSLTKVTNLIRLGLTLDEIAEFLECSTHSIKQHVKLHANTTYIKYEKQVRLKFRTSVHQNLAQQSIEKGDWKAVHSLLKDLEKEDKQSAPKRKPKKDPQPMRIGDGLFDINYIKNLKKIKEYDRQKHEMRYGIMLNETFSRSGPMYMNVEVWIGSEEETDKIITTIHHKLQQSEAESKV